MESDELKLLVLSGPRVLASLVLEDTDQKELEKLLDEHAQDDDEGFGIKWWAALLCRAKYGSVDMGLFKVAPRCGLA